MSDLSVTATSVLLQTGAHRLCGTLGEAMTAGQVAYISTSDGFLYKADNASHPQAVGILLNNGGAGQPGYYVTDGPVAISNVVAGTIYVVSSTAGGIAPSDDLRSGAYVTILGVGTSTGVLTVNLNVTGITSTDTRNFTYTQIAGAPPDPRNSSIFTWYDTLFAARQTNIRLMRGNVRYVKTSGSDAAAGTSDATAWQTLGQVQTYLSGLGANANVTILFNRGDTWREDQFLNIASFTSLGAYGSGAKPILSRFVYQYAASGWTDTGSGSYSRTETNAIVHVRFDDGTNDLTRPLIKASSLANCRATNDSFYWDSSSSPKKLHVRIGANTNANLVNLAGAIGSDGNYHVHGNGDNIRIENIRFEGYGMSATTGGISTYGIAMVMSGATDEAIVESCEVYFTGYHAIGMLRAGGTGLGGFGTIKNCTTGYLEYNVSSGGCTNLVGYSENGDMEFVCDGNVAAYGNRFINGAAGSGRTAQAIYSHTNTGANNLVIYRGNSITSGTYGCLQGVNVNALAVPTASVITDARYLVIDDIIDDSGQADGYRTEMFPLPTNGVEINCKHNCGEVSTGQQCAGAPGTGWSINSYHLGTNASDTRQIFKPAADGGQMLYCHVRQIAQTGVAGALFEANADAAGWDGFTADSCILECVQNDEALAYCLPNLDNTAGKLTYNAWHARDPVPATAGIVTGNGAGAIGDAHKVFIAAPTGLAAPYSNSPLVGAANPSISVNYDYNRATRTVATAGPLIASVTARPAISSIGSVVLWLKAGQYVVGTWTASVGSDWTQSNGANQPAVGSHGGIQGGANKYLTGATGALGTFTVIAVCVGTSATVRTVLGSNTTTGAYAGIFSDNNAYIIDDANNHKVAGNCTGTYVGRWVRVPSASYFRGSLIDAATMDNPTAGNCTFTRLLARTGGGGEYSHSSFELVELIVCNADIRGTSNEAIILEDLYQRLGVTIL